MTYDNAGGIRDPLKQDLTLDFCRKKHKDIRLLTETHFNHDQIRHQINIRNNWMGCIFFHPRDSHTKGSLALIDPVLEGITEVETDPKGEFVSFKVTPLSLMTEFCVYVPSGYSTREQLARERFFKGLQNYM